MFDSHGACSIVAKARLFESRKVIASEEIAMHQPLGQQGQLMVSEEDGHSQFLLRASSSSWFPD
jgi:hypothetical protein